MEKPPAHRPPNRLKDESSPYLLQHQHNPVDWYPWGKVAFARARDEDKPILLSIGYSACHWCHVMAHESFEDDETAAQMNRDFINIKVDREEHPDVDQVYQHALNLFDEHGGWPLTMFLLPTGEPFFGGTYYPPREAYGRPSFRRVMSAMHNAYHTQRGDVTEQAKQLVTALGQLESRAAASPSDAELPSNIVARVTERLATRIDPQRGGFAGAPKFPNPTSLSLFLRAFAKKRTMETAYPTLLTLSAMGEGGIYDHLGGGFARYSTDEKWLVPHFEKMLYDNAQLFRLLAESNRIAQELSLPAADHYAELIAETHGWLEREMRDPSGGLYAAQDADSEGVEGKYFVWSPDEIAAVLPPETATLFCRHYDIVPGGNWNDPHGHGPRGKSIPHIVAEPEGLEVKAQLDAARKQLLTARRKRIPPGTDDKILCGWNGLCISGLAEAGRLLGERRYIDSAQRTADFVLSRMRDGNGQLLRTFKDDTAKLPATLDDHAFLAEGLFHLAHATQDFRYFTAMREIMDALLAGFYDPEKRLFFLGPDDSDGVKLCARPVSLHDSAIPSGLSVACLNLLRLAALLDVEDSGRTRYQDIAEKTLRGLAEQALRNPFGLSNLVAAMDLLQNGLVVAVIVDSSPAQDGRPSSPSSPSSPSTAGRALHAATTTRYVPDLFTIVSSQDSSALPKSLLHHVIGKRAVDGKASAYVCVGPRCTAPITDAQELATRLISP